MVAHSLTKIVKADGQRLPEAEASSVLRRNLRSAERNTSFQILGHFVDAGLRALVVSI
jgi:hypothetical protein